MATITVSPADITAVLSGSIAPGDQIVLSPGDYTSLNLTGREWSTPVTFHCGTAVIGSTLMRRVKGLRISGGFFKNLRFDPGGADIEVEDVEFFGDGRVGYGLFLYGLKGVASRRCNFKDYKIGVVHQTVEDFECVGHTFDHMRSDGINVAMSHRGLIARNRMTGTEIVSTEHPDFIQLWSRPWAAPTSDIVIEDNACEGDTQGICAFNHEYLTPERDSTPLPYTLWDGRVLTERIMLNDGGVERIAIRRNDLQVATAHGITVGKGDHIEITDNRIRTLPGAVSQAIVRSDGCTNLTRHGNTAEAYELNGRVFAAIIDPAGPAPPPEPYDPPVIIPPPPIPPPGPTVDYLAEANARIDRLLAERAWVLAKAQEARKARAKNKPIEEIIDKLSAPAP